MMDCIIPVEDQVAGAESYDSSLPSDSIDDVR